MRNHVSPFIFFFDISVRVTISLTATGIHGYSWTRSPSGTTTGPFTFADATQLGMCLCSRGFAILLILVKLSVATLGVLLTLLLIPLVVALLFHSTDGTKWVSVGGYSRGFAL